MVQAVTAARKENREQETGIKTVSATGKTNMQIIDIHAHVFPDPIARKATDSIGEFYHMPTQLDEGSVSQLIRLHREAGIDHACIHSVAVTPHSVDSINRFISDTAAQYPDRVTGFGAIHPGREDLPGLAEKVKKLGLKGFKIHPDMQKFALDSPEAMKMFEAIEGKLPILIHTGDPRFEYSNPRRMKKALDAFPKLICICAHLGGWSEWEEACETLSGYENVYVDTSSSLYALSREEGRRIIRRYSRDRVLFGTDYPMWKPKEELERFLRLKLTDAEEEKILCRNAAELLGIRL